MIRSIAVAALAATVLYLPFEAKAHNVWLLPSSTVLAKAETVTVDAAVSNDLFFFNHVPLGLDHLRIKGPDGRTLAPENPHRGRLRSVFDLPLDQPGTYQLAVINSGVVASYRFKGETQRWRGSPEALAREIPAQATDLQVTESLGRIETFVTLGKPTPVTASGQGLELQAITHPNDLVSGEAASFVLLLEGKPAVGIEVTAIRGGTRYRDKPEAMTATTDAQGRFSFTWPAAGMYWLEATARDRHVSVPQARERRLTYALTLEVMPD